MNNRVLVLDIGGSSIKYTVYDDKDRKYEKGKVKTPMDTIDNLISVIKEIADSVEEYSGVAVSMPGFIDSDTGYVRAGGALQYIRELNFAEVLKEILNKPVVIENDAKSAVVAEFKRGNLKGVNTGVAVILGTGIGGGIIANGKLLKGNNLMAGEFSFINGNINEKPSLENLFAGQCGIMGLSNEVYKTSHKENLSGIEIFELIKKGDKKVEEGMKNFCRNLAAYIYNLQFSIDPECFVIGGGISEEPLFMEFLKEEVENKAKEYFVPVIIPDVRVCKFRNEANLLGALYNYREKTLS